MAGLCPAQENASGQDSPRFADHFWVSGQINLIMQGHPAFRSLYSGPQSFAAPGEVQTSRVLTLYTGVSLSPVTDFVFHLEETNGRNLSGSHGLASFPNVDLAGVPDARPYVARAIVHHSFRLGGAETDAGQGPLQMAAKVAEKRFDMYAGKMSLLDFFDVNAIGSDSHYQFMNWTLDNNAAYGYPADSRGYTFAVVGEYHNGNWTARVGEALTPKTSDTSRLDVNLARARSESAELEFHHTLIPHRAGVLRLLGFADHGSFASYRAAIEGAKAGQTQFPDVSSFRVPGRVKYGFGVNAEQELSPTLRAFARFGWTEGHMESLAFTEADATVSGGLDLRGNRWRRKDDKLGVALVSNALSGDHREYLRLGGTGLVLGDGGLNYRREEVLEAYYTAKIRRGVFASFDLQRIWNPGYNQDRGPALVAAFRLHLEGGILTNPH